MNFVRHLFILFVLAHAAFSKFTEDFANFLESNYGEKFTNILQRSDLGEKGSFGGRSNLEEETLRDPVIFIHGVSDMAGERMRTLADQFRVNGYKSGELYSTTYADGSHGNPIQFTFYSMRCEYVKQVRALILAVRYYTRRDVDIVAYSLGVTIARKAIMGGFCVDTDDDLGGPLTKYIDTFVGIAGPNHGITYKFIGIPLPGCVLGTPPICDRIIGLYSGICPLQSLFLNDINSKEHYEGKHVFSIFSQNDQMVGYRVCDKITSSIPGEDGHKSYLHVSHADLLMESVNITLKFLSNHTADTYSLLALQRAAPTLKTSTVDADLIFPDVHDTNEAQQPLNTEAIFSETNPTSMTNIRKYFREQREENVRRGSKPLIHDNKITKDPEDDQTDVEVSIHDVTIEQKTTMPPSTIRSTIERSSSISTSTQRIQTTRRPTVTTQGPKTFATFSSVLPSRSQTTEVRTTLPNNVVLPEATAEFGPSVQELRPSEDGYYHTRIRIKIEPDTA